MPSDCPDPSGGDAAVPASPLDVDDLLNSAMDQHFSERSPVAPETLQTTAPAAPKASSCTPPPPESSRDAAIGGTVPASGSDVSISPRRRLARPSRAAAGPEPPLPSCARDKLLDSALEETFVAQAKGPKDTQSQTNSRTMPAFLNGPLARGYPYTSSLFPVPLLLPAFPLCPPDPIGVIPGLNRRCPPQSAPTGLYRPAYQAAVPRLPYNRGRDPARPAASSQFADTKQGGQSGQRTQVPHPQATAPTLLSHSVFPCSSCAPLYCTTFPPPMCDCPGNLLRGIRMLSAAPVVPPGGGAVQACGVGISHDLPGRPSVCEPCLSVLQQEFSPPTGSLIV
eukprot:gene8322-1486_t